MKVWKQKKTVMLNPLNHYFCRFIFLTGILFLLSACESRPNGVLNESKMAIVLTEMHKTDAILNEKGLTFGHYYDKSPYYSYIFKKYKITQVQFDSSLVWYSKNPRVFSNIYDKVLINLTGLQKEVKIGKFHPVDTVDLSKMRNFIWNKRIRYILTKDSARTHLDFLIADNNLMYGDLYILKFLIRIAPEDSCKKPGIVLRINYANGKTDSVFRSAFNDSILRRYTFRFRAFRKLKIKSVSGELLASKMYKGKMNVTIDSISMFREFNARKQDSLRKEVEMATPGFNINSQKTNIDSHHSMKKFINRRFYHQL
jgi:hypothetical protein